MFMYKKLYILGLLFLSVLYSEDWEYSADAAEIKQINREQVKQFNGNVFITKGSLELKTKQALQYPEREQIHLYGDIQMIDNNTAVQCDQLVYHTSKNYSVAYNDVIVNQENRTIYCDTLYYWDEADSLKGLGNIRIIEKGANRKLQSGQLYIASPDSVTQILEL